jgi:hypothetical protein
MDAVDGPRVFIRALLAFGIKPEEIKVMLQDNSAKLMCWKRNRREGKGTRKIQRLTTKSANTQKGTAVPWCFINPLKSSARVAPLPT